MPVFGTIASRFNDDGVTALYQHVAEALRTHGLRAGGGRLPVLDGCAIRAARNAIVPPARVRYLADIAQTVRAYRERADAQARVARERWQLAEARRMLAKVSRHRRGTSRATASAGAGTSARQTPQYTPSPTRRPRSTQRTAALGERERKLLDTWPHTVAAYSGDEYVVKIRDQEIRTALTVDDAVRHRQSARSRCRSSRTTARSCAG